MEFSLVPFRADAPVSMITGQLERHSNQLMISFYLPERQRIIWPEPANQPERQTGLWSSTCFECFLHSDDPNQYFECNISPSGHWQMFRFQSYRQPPLSVTDQAMVREITIDAIGIHCLIEINDPRFVTNGWQVSPACILADENGLNYYANQHPIDQPDFHLANLRRYSLPST